MFSTRSNMIWLTHATSAQYIGSKDIESSKSCEGLWRTCTLLVAVLRDRSELFAYLDTYPCTVRIHPPYPMTAVSNLNRGDVESWYGRDASGIRKIDIIQSKYHSSITS